MEEHIKREHHQSAKKPGAPAPKQRNRVTVLLLEMWPAYLIEIFVIIIGIWITFAIEQWRDNSKEAELEKVYYKNLLIDLNADQRSLKYTIDNTRAMLASGNELSDQISSRNLNRRMPPTADKINSDLHAILSRPKFITSDATFSDLKSSGNIRLLKDVRLKNLLFSYYSIAQGIKETQDAEQQATIIVTGPYFFKHFAMGNIGDNDYNSKQLHNLASDPELANNLLLRIHNRNELLEEYLRADSLAREVKKELEGQTRE
jgi:hypothetical protein